MKILLITDLYPIKKGECKTPKTLHNFVFNWILQNHTVDVIKPNFLFNSFVRKKPFYKTGFYKFEGVNIFNVNYSTPFLFDFEKKIPKELDISSYDIIIAHMPSGIIFANKLAKKYNKPLICGIHSSDFAILKNPTYKYYFRTELIEAYKNAKRISCRSFVIYKNFLEIFPEFEEKTFTAPSGVDCDLIRKKKINFHSPIKIITCANLIQRKNIDKLIYAVNDSTDFELKIIGLGPELKKLKKIASKNITFLGKLDHEEVLNEMQLSDIFALPSVSETFGMVYLEAMACGCITVCTKDDGVDGIIKDGYNGFLTYPTIQDIQKTLLKIKNSTNLEEICENNFETVNLYTSDFCSENYLTNCMIEK